MTKPRITIDKHGWVRNDQAFPFGLESRVAVRFVDGTVVPAIFEARHYDFNVLGNYADLSHWRFA